MDAEEGMEARVEDDTVDGVTWRGNRKSVGAKLRWGVG